MGIAQTVNGSWVSHAAIPDDDIILILRDWLAQWRQLTGSMRTYIEPSIPTPFLAIGDYRIYFVGQTVILQGPWATARLGSTRIFQRNMADPTFRPEDWISDVYREIYAFQDAIKALNYYLTYNLPEHKSDSRSAERFFRDKGIDSSRDAFRFLKDKYGYVQETK